MAPLSILILTAMTLAAWAPAAEAYVDPTAAGAAVQSAYVVVVGALITVAMVPKKVAAGLRWLASRLPRRPKPPPGDGG